MKSSSLPTAIKMGPKTQILTALGACMLGASISAQGATILVSEGFGGLSTASLWGTTADTFSSAIVTAGGSATWSSGGSSTAAFKKDGSVSSPSATRAVHLKMGTYINDAKGDSDGLFELTAIINRPTAGGLSFGFASATNPAYNSSYVGNNGVGTMIYFSNGDIDQYSLQANEVAPDNILHTGSRTLTITLDLRNYNGTSNFGSASFADSVLGSLGSYNFAAATDFNSILLSTQSTNVTTTGAYDSLTLTQIPEPGAAFLGGLGLLALLRRRR